MSRRKLSMPAVLRSAVVLLVLGALVRPVHAADAEPAAPVRPQVAADGPSVIDASSRLVWARCVEGMQWDGKGCVGEAQLMSHAQAVAAAAQRAKAEGQAWRLPRVNELRRLVDRRARPVGPNPQLYPGALRDWHWSGTASVPTGIVNPYAYGNVMQGRTQESGSSESFVTGWAVHLGNGESRSDVAKGTRLAVRLVRPL